MTNTPRVMQLMPADWRQLVLLNLAQAHDFISSIAPMTEAGISALTDEQMTIYQRHVARGQELLTGWRKSRMPGIEAEAAKPAQAQPQANGAVPVKRKGGWPLGKPRKTRAQAESTQ